MFLKRSGHRADAPMLAVTHDRPCRTEARFSRGRDQPEDERPVRPVGAHPPTPFARVRRSGSS